MISHRDTDLAVHIEAFFTGRLYRERQASQHTVAAYRDTFRLLLSFAKDQLGREPAKLAATDIDSALVAAFLDHLEKKRDNTVRTRNARLAAIHSFFRYLALRQPDHSALAQRILSIPSKRTTRRLVEFLDESEVRALLNAPNLHTWSGRRDRALLLMAVQTGLRVSELTGLSMSDIVLEKGGHVRCQGKGRKERCTPIRRDAQGVLRQWLRERCGSPTDTVFPNARGERLTRDGVAYILAQHVETASVVCPSLSRKRVTPHTLRHTTAMTLLQHGVDRAVIALWLGHESVDSTDSYLHADLKLKQRALDRTSPRKLKGARYQPRDRLLAFLESL